MKSLKSVAPASAGLGAGRIVFGAKLQPWCQPFAEVAALLARRLKVPLRLVHVAEDTRAPSVIGTDEEHLLGPVRSELNAEAERLRTFSGASVAAQLAAGNVVDTLLSVARMELATALVLGAGVDGNSALVGAAVERASRESHVPVLVLREPERLLAWLRGERALRVLVGADLGRASESARAFASAWSALGPVEVEVALVITPLEARERLRLSPREPEQTEEQQAQALLAGDLRRCAPADTSAKLRVLVGRASADAHLVMLAEQENFDLIVVGQRRRSLPDQLWYGSVARGVLRSAPVSVVSVPALAAPHRHTFRAPRVVLVATDFGEAGNGAVAQGVGMVMEGGAVHLAHVVAVGAASPEEARYAREQAWYALSRLVSAQNGDRVAKFERHVLDGSPTFELLALAERVGADLIVLGARSRAAGGAATLGSVARSVSERAKVPVLLVPMPRP
ncbi:MAG TPA: universal stress protein [Polyangiaceae bacterium]|nr:universal stress protein [Polyangiaceae bacterium]